MKIIVVAGGLATRLKPIAEKIPKCLIDINGTPLVERQLMYFKRNGFKDFIFCVAHLAEKVEEYFGDGSKCGINIEYVKDNLMGTAGAVKLAEDLVDDDFIVYFADILTSIDFNKLVLEHKKNNALGTVCLRPLPEGYKSSSVITLDPNKRIKSFLEKPSMEEIEKITEQKYINSSTYVFKKDIFKFIPEDEKYDFGKQLFPNLVKRGENLFGYPTTEFFREIGRMEKYEKFMQEFKGVKKIL